MPKSKTAQKIYDSMIEKHGEEAGKRIFYATANKQNRDPDNWEVRESLKLVDNLIVEDAGVIIIIPAGSSIKDQTMVHVENIIKNGIVLDLEEDYCTACDCDHNREFHPNLIGSDIGEIMSMVMEFADDSGMNTHVVPVSETVGIGAIAMKPAALEVEDDEDEDVKESSNSQVSELQQDY